MGGGDAFRPCPAHSQPNSASNIFTMLGWSVCRRISHSCLDWGGRGRYVGIIFWRIGSGQIRVYTAFGFRTLGSRTTLSCARTGLNARCKADWGLPETPGQRYRCRHLETTPLHRYEDLSINCHGGPLRFELCGGKTQEASSLWRMHLEF